MPSQRVPAPTVRRSAQGAVRPRGGAGAGPHAAAGGAGGTTGEPLYRESPRRRAKRLLREQIDSGALAIGAELPVERDLAARFGVPRATLSRAIAELQADGLIRHVRGRTRVVVGRPAGAPGAGGRAPAVDPLPAATVVVLAPPLSHAELPASPGSPDWTTLAATTALRAAGCHALVLDSGRVSAAELAAAAAHGYAGLVLAAINAGTRVDTARLRPVIEAWRHQGAPIAVFGDELADATLDRVVPDHRAGARLLVDWLVARGHRRILQQSFIGLDTPWWRERRAGYEDGMRAAGLPPSPPVALPHDERGTAMDGASLDRRARAYEAHLRRMPACDALMAVTDSTCFPLLRAWRRLRRRHEVVLVGYDHVAQDCWESAHEPLPGLVSIDRRMADCGQALIAVLQRRQREPGSPPVRRLVGPVLVPGSTMPGAPR